MEEVITKLKKYVEYLKKSKNVGYEATMEEREAAYYVHVDKSLSNVMEDAESNENIDNQIIVIEDYIRMLEEKLKQQKVGIQEEQKKEQEQVIEEENNKQIDINGIDHYKLNNGIEVYSFVNKNGQRVVVENKNGSLNNLSGDLNEMEELEQSSDKINFAQIDEFLANPDNFRGLNDEQMSNIKKIIENKDSMNIKFINKDNMLAIDGNGSVIEAYYDNNTNTSNIGVPKSYNYGSNNLESNQSINTGTVATIVTPELQEGEKKEEEDHLSSEEIANIQAEMEAKGINIPLEEVKSNISMYYESPLKLDEDLKNGTLDEKTKSFYEDMSSMHAETTSKQNANTNTNGLTKQMNLTLKSDNTNPVQPNYSTQSSVSSDQKGIVSIFILAMILFVVAAVILFTMKS